MADQEEVEKERHLLIDIRINCGDVHCMNCRHRDYGYCLQFNASLIADELGKDGPRYFRLADCLAVTRRTERNSAIGIQSLGILPSSKINSV